MININRIEKILIVAFLVALVPALCLAGGKKHHGTRVNGGVHADTGIPNGDVLRFVVQYLNPSSNPITITEIRVFRPDGTQVYPNFALDGFPPPPFELGAFESKGFALMATGIQPVNIVPRGVFQIHADWKSSKPTNGLKSTSVVITVKSGFGAVSKIAIEGFDVKYKGNKGNDGDSNDD